MKRVLLTGGAGAIGVHVLAYLLEKTDWDVVVLDSFRHKGYKDRIDQICEGRDDWRTRLKDKIFQHDLVCPIATELKEKIGKIDYILHLAAMSDVFWGQENRVYVVYNNVYSTLMLLEYAREIKPEAFIYFSTDEVYGPVKEGEAHKEWATHRPSNYYAASKAAGEDLCYAAWRSDDLPLIITNTMNNFGPMQAPSKYPAMIQSNLQRGETVIVHGNEKEIGSRFYIDSRNVVDALLFILRKKPPRRHKIGELDEPDRYHIVGETRYDNLGLAKTIARLGGWELKYEMKDFHKENPAHDIHYGLEDNKLRPGGWKQPLDTEASLKNTIDWQKSHPEWL